MAEQQQTAGTGSTAGTMTGSDIGGQAKVKAREAAEMAKSESQRLASVAKDKAKSVIAEQKDAAAESLGGVAGALRETAKTLGEQSPALGQYTERAAQSLEGFSHTLRDRDVDSLIGQLEDFARRQPLVFVGGAVLAGFALSRFLKASAEARAGSYGEHRYSSPQGYGAPDYGGGSESYTGQQQSPRTTSSYSSSTAPSTAGQTGSQPSYGAARAGSGGTTGDALSATRPAGANKAATNPAAGGGPAGVV
jgi:hypothetical protein